MPLGCDDFLGGEFDGLGSIGCIGEDVGVANKNAHNEQRASEVAEEGDSPMFQHLDDAGATVESRYRCEL